MIPPALLAFLQQGGGAAAAGGGGGLMGLLGSNKLGIAGLGLGAVSGLMGKSSTDKANEQLMKQLAEAMKIAEEERGNQKRTLGRSEATAGRAVGVSEKGTERSLAEASMVGGAATRQILGAGKVERANVDADLGSRGLYNSTAATRGRGATVARTQTRLQSLAESLAALRSGVIDRGTTRTTGATMNLAQNQSERARQEMQSALATAQMPMGLGATGGGSPFGGAAGIAAILSLFKKGS